ncbi:MAG: hypothetical protein OXG35_20095 [Acidobacteria bacterium]|nr:hypothetical protein [Acidobacteriota bacterium]
MLVKLLLYSGPRPTLVKMAIDLFLSTSQVHAALIRLAASRLVLNDARESTPNSRAAEEFLVHGVKYAFPAIRGAVTRGMLTSYAAPPLNGQVSGATDLPPVWPFASGRDRGISLAPLHKMVPLAARADRGLYEMLALLDALRDGRAREKNLAEQEIIERVRRSRHA